MNKIIFSTFLLTGSLCALPTGSDFVSGGGLVTLATPTQLIVTVSADNNYITWDTFSIGTIENVKFTNGTGSITPYMVTNQVTGGVSSVIAGSLVTGNGEKGTILLVNPYGMVFTSTAMINTTAFLASTLDIVGGKDGVSPGSPIHFAAITAEALTSGITIDGGAVIHGTGGDITYISQHINDSGTTTAAGTISLGAGLDIMYQPSESQRIYINASSIAASYPDGILEDGSLSAEVVNLIADGNLYQYAINLEGLVQTTVCSSGDGQILIIADPTFIDDPTVGAPGEVVISGTITRQPVTGQGPTVEIYGNAIDIADGALIDMSGTEGGGNINIGALSPYLTNYIYVADGATIRSDALVSGSGGTISLTANISILDLGVIEALGVGAGGNGGDANISCNGYLGLDGIVNLGSALANPGVLTTTTSAMDLGIIANYGSYFAPPSYAQTSVSSMITLAALQQALGYSDVTVVANGAQVTGNINVEGTVVWASGSELIINAVNNIQMDALLEMIVSGYAGTPIVNMSGANITIGNALGTETQSVGVNLASGNIIASASDSIYVYGSGIANNLGYLSTGSGTNTINFLNNFGVYGGENTGSSAVVKGTSVNINSNRDSVGAIVVMAEDCSRAFIDGTTVQIGVTNRPQSLTITGGSCSSGNEAYIGSITGGSNITIDVAGDITINGGPTGTANRGSIVSSGGLGCIVDVTASNVQLFGGATPHGGNGGVNNEARIVSLGSNGIVNVTTIGTGYNGNLFLLGGGLRATGAAAYIKGKSVNVTVGQNLDIYAGTGPLNYAYIEGYTNISAIAGGDINFMSGNSNYVNAYMMLDSAGPINVTSLGGNVNIQTGTGVYANAFIQTTNGDITVEAAKNVNLQGSCTIPNEAYILAGGNGEIVIIVGQDITLKGDSFLEQGNTNTVPTVYFGGRFQVLDCSYVPPPPSPPSPEPVALLSLPGVYYYDYTFLYELFYRLRYFTYYDWNLFHTDDFWNRATYTDP